MSGLSLNTSRAVRSKLTMDQQRQIQRAYSRAAEQVESSISRYSTQQNGTSYLQTERLRVVQQQMLHNLSSVNKDIEAGILGSMRGVVESVVTDNKAFLAAVGFPTSDAFMHVPDEVVRSVATGTLYAGDWSLSGAIWSNIQKQQSDINSILASGLAQGKSAYSLAKDLERYVDPSARKDWEWSKVYPGTAKKIDYNAQRLARTTISHAYQQALVRTTAKNPYITGLKWQASSGRACELCQDRDGKVFPKDDLPLDHPNGMCTFTAVMEKSLTEIADDLADWAQGKDNPALDEWAEDIYGSEWAAKQAKAAMTKSNPDKLPEKLLDIVGYRGAPASIQDAVKAVNPNYTPKDKRWSWNCQRCAPTYEMQRRGYDVEALPFDGDYPSFTRVFAYDAKDYGSYVALNPGSKYMSAYGSVAVNNPNYFKRGTAEYAAKTIVDAMTRWGDGSRAMLSVCWKTSGAHILNVENVGGEVWLVDAQIGKITKGQQAIERYMSMTTVSNSELFRVDNLGLRTDTLSKWPTRLSHLMKKKE